MSRFGIRLLVVCLINMGAIVWMLGGASSPWGGGTMHPITFLFLLVLELLLAVRLLRRDRSNAWGQALLTGFLIFVLAGLGVCSGGSGLG